MALKPKILLLFLPFFLSTYIFASDPVIDSLIQEVNLTNNSELKCNLFNEIALEYLYLDPSQSIFYANKSFQLSFRTDYKKGLATSYLIQGRAYQKLNDFEEALDKYFSSLIIQEHLNRENEIAEIYYRLGRVCKTIGNYEQALEYCLNSLRIREKQNKPLDVAAVYNTMGSIYKYIGDYEQSFEFYYKCRDIQEKYRKNGVSSGTYNNIGIVYKLVDKPDQALAYYNKSLDIRKGIHDSVGIASSYNNIAGVFLDQGKLDSAIFYLNKSLEIKKYYQDKRKFISLYYNFSSYYLQLKDYKRALDYTNKSLSIAKELKIANSIKEAYSLLKDIYQAQGLYGKALDYQIEYTRINDSIFNMEKYMRIAQLETLYENELKQVEQDLKDQKTLFVNIGIFGILFFLLIVLFFIYKNLKLRFKQNKLERANLEMEKAKLTDELANKKRDLTRNIIHLTEKNELILDLRKKLQKLKSNMKAENKPLVQSVINDMKASTNNKIWEEFEIRFNNVHKVFYDKLSKNHPGLTQNERRLTAFLKLNMSTKEISMITKQSVHSIEVARTRLRKKLGLSHTDINLVTYLDKY